MLSIGTAYFYRLNKQPAKDLRRLKSLPVSAFCIQDGSKIEKLIESDIENFVSVDGLVVVGNTKSARAHRISGTRILIAEFDNFTIVNVNVNKDNFDSQSASNLKYEANQIFNQFKNVMKSIDSDKIFIVGNFNILNEFPGLTKRKSASHLFKKLKYDYVYNGDNYIAYRVEEPKVEIIDSKELGSDQDWMVAHFA